MVNGTRSTTSTVEAKTVQIYVTGVILYRLILNLGSSTAAYWVSFDLNVSCSSCWGYSLINTLKLKKKLNDIILHIEFLNDIIMFSKIVWHSYVKNSKIMSFNFLFELCRLISYNKLLMLFICHRIFKQYNNVTMCDHIISLNRFNNITHSMIFSL